MMDDEEFLRYCEGHSHTPRCGFVPESIARLLRLAGYHGTAERWDKHPNQVIDCNGDEIRKYVEIAENKRH